MNEPLYVLAKTPWGHALGGKTTEHPKDELLDTKISLINCKTYEDGEFNDLCERLGISPTFYGYCRPKDAFGYSDFFVQFETAEQALRMRLSLE